MLTFVKEKCGLGRILLHFFVLDTHSTCITDKRRLPLQTKTPAVKIYLKAKGTGRE